MEEKKTNKLFWIRAALWSLFACLLPIGFIAWRYDIFSKASSFSLSGWGIIAVIIACVFVFAVIKYVKAGFAEWSMTKQIISGVIKVLLPLGGLLAICVSLMNGLEVFIQALSVVLVSEAIAIPLNPFPEWVWVKSQGRFESAADFIADKLYNRKKGE